MKLNKEYIQNRIHQMYDTSVEMCKKHNIEPRMATRFMNADVDFKISSLDSLCKALKCSIVDITGIDYSNMPKKAYVVNRKTVAVCEAPAAYGVEAKKDRIERDYYKSLYETVNEEYNALLEINKSLRAQLENLK